jgi:hypothetical protein
MQRYVWERAWRSRADLKRLGMMRGEILPEDASAPVRAAASPDDILIAKAGGDSGIYSTLIKIYIGMPATTVAIRAGRNAP